MYFFDTGESYEKMQIELLEKYGTVNAISLIHVVMYPRLYKINNEYKIFNFIRNTEINLENQDYYNIVFELIVQNRLTLVNLYKATEGDLQFFYEIFTFGNMYKKFNHMLYELEYYPDIIVQLAKSNKNTEIILDYLINQEPNHL